MKERVYESARSAWYHVANEVLHLGEPIGSRDGASRECIAFAFTLTDPRDNFASTRPKMSARYAAGELAWYLSGSGRVEPIAFYAPQYSRFADENGIVRGAYGERLARYNQLYHVVNELRARRDSRRAVLSMFMPQDVVALSAGSADLPCTLNLQLLIRDDRLHMIARMRSNDVWLGLPYDMFCFTAIQCMLADCLEVAVGTYRHEVGSMHIYTRDVDKVQSAVRDAYTGAPGEMDATLFPAHSMKYVVELTEAFTGLEYAFRSAKIEGRDAELAMEQFLSQYPGDEMLRHISIMLA